MATKRDVDTIIPPVDNNRSPLRSRASLHSPALISRSTNGFIWPHHIASLISAS
jgi:hypothetical protein